MPFGGNKDFEYGSEGGPKAVDVYTNLKSVKIIAVQTGNRIELMKPQPDTDTASWAMSLLNSRRTQLPKRLAGPAPDQAQKRLILEAASSAPDHDQILPWRFIEIPDQFRTALGVAFEEALHERDPEASIEERRQAHEKALRSPWLLVAIARTGGSPANISATERLISAGAAILNMLLIATAFGLGSSLTSGKAMDSSAIRSLLRLGIHEQALCFLNFGHITEPRKPRSRPSIEQYFSRLELNN